jgi:hypothetical protein
MVVVSDEMKDAMYHYPVQFLIEVCFIESGILPDGIHADKQIAGNLLTLAIVEGYDIRKVIVAQILNVDIQDVRIGAEYYVNIAETPDLAFGHEFEPGIVETPVLILEFYILKKVPDHSRIDKNYANLQQKLELKLNIHIFTT